MSSVLSARDVRKVYAGGDGRPLEILAGVDLDVAPGKFIAIVGASGAGKSTCITRSTGIPPKSQKPKKSLPSSRLTT